MVVEDRGGRCVVFGEKKDMMVGSEFNRGNKRFLDCRVDGIANGEGIGVVR